MRKVVFVVGLCGVFVDSFVLLPVTPCLSSPRWSSSSSSAYSSSTPTTTVSPHDDCQEPLWLELSRRFQGDFDNYRQVIEDRSAGLLPRSGGGHEHIHCTLVPLSNHTRLAAFYFDGMPQAIFRFRYYELLPVYTSTGFCVDTVLYTLDPELEQELRQVATEPLAWPKLYANFIHGEIGRIQRLPNCEVRWSWQKQPVHYYATLPNGIHAVMVHGQAIVNSQQRPGTQILIQDQLSLYPDLLYIHDRGFDPVTMEFIYGNQRNVPYRMERVTTIRNNRKQQRTIVNTELKWTLGPASRSIQEYQQRMQDMGGPSIPKRS